MFSPPSSRCRHCPQLLGRGEAPGVCASAGSSWALPGDWQVWPVQGLWPGHVRVLAQHQLLWHPARCSVWRWDWGLDDRCSDGHSGHGIRSCPPLEHDRVWQVRGRGGIQIHGSRQAHWQGCHTGEARQTHTHTDIHAHAQHTGYLLLFLKLLNLEEQFKWSIQHKMSLIKKNKKFSYIPHLKTNPYHFRCVMRSQSHVPHPLLCISRPFHEQCVTLTRLTSSLEALEALVWSWQHGSWTEVPGSLFLPQGM